MRKGREEALEILGGGGGIQGVLQEPPESPAPVSNASAALTAPRPSPDPTSLHALLESEVSQRPRQRELPGPQQEIKAGTAQLCQEKETLHWRG